LALHVIQPFTILSSLYFFLPKSPTNHDFICASFVQQANDAEAGGRLLWSQLASSSGITISSITFDPFTASTVSAWNL
jgi:hypothetical protein